MVQDKTTKIFTPLNIMLSEKFSNISLKKKIIFLMGGLVTVTPTILVAILALSYYHLGIDKLFHDKVSSAISQTVKIAELYYVEHKDKIKADILGLAGDISRNYLVFEENPELFDTFLNKQAEIRTLSEAMIFTPTQVLGRTYLSFSLTFESISEYTFNQAQNGDVVIIDSDREDRVRALIKLDQFADTYLLVGRYIDTEIINNLKLTKGSETQYKSLLADKKKTKLKLEFVYIISSIILCIGAVMIGAKLAKIIIRPINLLVDATAKIKEGDYTVRVPENNITQDEISILAKAFNSMTQKIASQTTELINIKNLTDERRRFIEAVLKEVSSGVIVIDSKNILTLCNQSAAKLLERSESDIINKDYKIFFPEIEKLLSKAAQSTEITEGNLTIERSNKKQYLFIRIGGEFDNSTIERYTITFYDISKLINAQRAAAWADIARRIAHEIKNPLTPIHLSAEQLERKFLKEISSDPALFSKYTNTIIRHVTDIGNMVEEFVQFARIPQPKLAKYDLYKIINEVIFSQKSIHDKTEYKFDKVVEACYIICDRAQITQVLINLFKNANEAISAKAQSQIFQPRIIILCQIDQHNDHVLVSISDNGQGIDKNIMDRIAEPYTTTKVNGTGLGLSIVKKILEDHGSVLHITNNDLGASASFKLNLYRNSNKISEDNNAN